MTHFSFRDLILYAYRLLVSIAIIKHYHIVFEAQEVPNLKTHIIWLIFHAVQ
jgi:hypothetical protein